MIVNRTTSFLFGLALVLCASQTFAARPYPLSGESNMRLQVGGGLPLPIMSTTSGTTGRILPVPNATVRQQGGPDPKIMTIHPGQMTNPAAPQFSLGQFANNQALFSIQSNVSFAFPAPGADVRFEAGGRTGPPTYTDMPGGAFASNFMRYKKTTNQFGGPGRVAINGNVTLWLIGGLPPACAPGPSCIALKVLNTPPPPIAAIGRPFASGALVSSPPIQTPGIYVVGANSAGSIFFRTPTPSGNPPPAPFSTNAGTTEGGPWTTGIVTVSAANALGSPEKFTITGSDNRVDGVGTISLVAGGLGVRKLTGANANRGWLHLKIGEQIAEPVPALPVWGFPALGVLLIGSGAALLRMMNRRAANQTT